MTRFKKGDKVVLSDRFYDEAQLNAEEKKPWWLEVFDKKVLEDGYVVLSGIRDDREGVYFFSADGVDVVLFDDWLEPYGAVPAEVPRLFTLLVLEDTPFKGRMLAEAPVDADIQSGDIVEIGRKGSTLLQVVSKCGLDRESDYYRCLLDLERRRGFEKITRYYKVCEVKESENGEVQSR